MKLKTTNSTFIIKVICAILFILFSFGFLYCYQADLIAMAQHVLSEGKTHYDKMVGADCSYSRISPEFNYKMES